jgi:hypothetical protein
MLTQITNGKMTKRTREAAKRLEKGICAPRSSKLSHDGCRRKQSLRLLELASVLVCLNHVARFRYRRAALFCLGAAFPFQAAIFQKLRAKRREYDCAVIANRFDRATFHRFFAERFLLRGLWLLVNVGMTPVVVAFETGRCRFATQIAVDALIIDVECPRYVFGVFVCDVGHSFYDKSEIQH